MIHFLTARRSNLFCQVGLKFNPFVSFASKLSSQSHKGLETGIEVERITKIINSHPFPDPPLQPTLVQCIHPAALSNTFIENVLGRLFAAHSNGLKALEFFKFCLHHFPSCATSDAFEKTLHILVRMRYFDEAWELMREIGKNNPSLLTLKSMSILLSKIAKFQSYEDTLAAFEKMETDLFVGRKFGIDEFNVLLQAFCTQRQMKEAKSVYRKMHSRFSPNTKTMNILLLGFKESGNITALELFYHQMVIRGFKPNYVTYNIRIDAYCKKGHFGDALRLFEEMEKENCLPTLETITTLIHGAGVARNITRAQQLFNEIRTRRLTPDIGAYNALISSFIRCKNVKAATALMDEMEEEQIGHDNVTYHSVFRGLMRSGGIEAVIELYHKMVKRNFVPKTRTVVMLMKLFCVSNRLDLGLDLWNYLVEKGYCPHAHALDLLVIGLCSRGMVLEAYECSKQTLERGRRISEGTFLILKRFLPQTGEMDKLSQLDQMKVRLKDVLPPSIEHTIDIP